MKKICLFLMMLIAILAGCSQSSTLIKGNSSSMRMDIFEELTNAGGAPQGFADLRITSTLKTHKPGMYSSSDIHGTRDYMLLVNIDGQAVLLQGSLQKENSEPVKLVDPEAGNGVRYRFSKNLRLKAGKHRVVVALPDDEIAVGREITLVEGDVNNLILEPIYSTNPGKKRPGINSATSFKEGVRTIRLILNGGEA